MYNNVFQWKSRLYQMHFAFSNAHATPPPSLQKKKAKNYLLHINIHTLNNQEIL